MKYGVLRGVNRYWDENGYVLTKSDYMKLINERNRETLEKYYIFNRTEHHQFLIY
jgi:hypothetical protein